jgi:hypothetical protein
MSAIPQLRPLTIGYLFDQTFTIYRKNFVTMVGIMAVLNVPLIALEMVAWRHVSAFEELLPFVLRGEEIPTPLLLGLSDVVLRFWGEYALLWVVWLCVVMVQMSALTIVVAEFYHGRTLTIGAAYHRTLQHARPLLVASLIFLVVNLVLGVFTVIPCLGWLIGPLLLVIIDTYWTFPWQAIVAENLGGVAGLRRSWQLIRGSFWHISVITFVLLMLVGAIASTPALAFTAAFAFISPSLLVTVLVNVLVRSILGLLTMPCYFVGMTLLYYDLRVRKEGYDLQQQLSEQ